MVSFAAWRPIPGFPGYEACDDGRIRHVSPRYRIRPVELWLAELVGEQLERRGSEVMSTWIETRNGRPAERVSLRVAGVKHNEFVHRLVCLAFHGEQPPDCPDCAHKDHNSLNNRASNLEWQSHSQNIQANYDRMERRFIEEESLAEVLAPHGDCDNVPF